MNSNVINNLVYNSLYIGVVINYPNGINSVFGMFGYDITNNVFFVCDVIDFDVNSPSNPISNAPSLTTNTYGNFIC